MTQSIKGQKGEEAENVFDEFRKMLTEPDAEVDFEQLGDLETLAGVSEFPSRIKCAILAWHTMKAAIEDTVEDVTTECAKEYRSPLCLFRLFLYLTGVYRITCTNLLPLFI